MSIKLIIPHPCCYGEEYAAALGAENSATHAVNSTSQRREDAAAAVERFTAAQHSSFQYKKALTRLWDILDSEIALLNALDAATRIREGAEEKCLLHPPLAPAPVCVSLVFPTPFPVPGRRSSAAALPCPSLWTVIDVAAATRASPLAHPACAALCLPATAATDKEMVRERFRRLAKLLHPDRWLLTWAAALESVPSEWAAILDVPLSKARGSAAARGTGKGISCSGFKLWTAADVRAAAGAAFVGAREAYEALSRSATQRC